MAWVVKRTRTDGGHSYKASWRDPSGRIRSQTFRRRSDADRFCRSLEHAKDTGRRIGMVAVGRT